MTEAVSEPVKQCRVCQEVKPLSDFSPNGLAADGSQRYYARCKPCNATAMIKYRNSRVEERMEYQKVRYTALLRLRDAHPEEFQTYEREEWAASRVRAQNRARGVAR